jgi:hypothetical protein
MFAGKTGAKPMKYSSLLQKSVNYGRKKFHNIGPRFPPPIPIIELRERQALDENVFVQELDDADFNETRQTNVTEDFGEEGADVPEVQVEVS